MTKLLVVEASASGPQASTRRIVKVFLENWKNANSSAEIVMRDVVAEPVPHVGAAYIENMKSPPGTLASRERKASAKLTQTLQSEVLDATHILIGTPMHIFSVPSALKAWTDHIFHNGVVFEGSAEGVKGLLVNKKAVLITSRGGDYRPPSPLASFDMLTPYFQSLFAFCGLTDFQAFDVHNGMFDPADHVGQVDQTLDQVAAFASTW